MKRGEVVVIHVYYNYTKFLQNRMKKKGLLIACFSVQNFKMSVELWKSYIVQWLGLFTYVAVDQSIQKRGKVRELTVAG